jgi:predicted PurR-regulated permease PerM
MVMAGVYWRAVSSPVIPARPTWDLTRIVLGVAAIGALVLASFLVLRPFLPALIWATMIVIATWPALRMVQARLWGKRVLAVVVLTLLMVIIVVMPIAVGVMALVEHGEALVSWTRALATHPLPPPPQVVRSLPVVGERIATAWQNVASASPDEIAERVRPHLRLILGWLIIQAGGLAVFFVQLVLTVVLAAILYAQGETVASGVLAFSRRLAGQAGERVAVLSAQAIRAVALGIVVTALVQAIIGGVGLAVTGVPHAMVLAAIMFVLGVAQIGPIPVLLGSIIYLYWVGEPLWGTVMVVWSVVTGSLDNFLRPVLIRRGADLPLLLIFAGVLGGLLAFGVVGLFIGPVVLAVTYTLLQNWVASGAPPEPAAPDPAR